VPRRRIKRDKQKEIELVKLQIKVLQDLLNSVDSIVKKNAKGELLIELKIWSKTIKRMLENIIIFKNKKLQRLSEQENK